MKKLIIKSYKYMFLLAFILSIGCADVLEEKPQSILGEATYYNTPAEFDAAMNGVLRSLWTVFGQREIFWITAGGEDLTVKPTAPDLRMADEMRVTPVFTGLNIWSYLYKTVNLSNMMIYKAQNATLLTVNEKLFYEAEARYCRALAYYYLTRLWGELPIVTIENVGSVAQLAKSPVIDVYDVIIEDLEFAEDNLPIDYGYQTALPPKAAAKGLLADVYLTMTGWPIKDATKYALARDKAKEVMDLNKYSLENNFGDLWLNAKKFINSEFIFFMTGTLSSGVSSSTHQQIRPVEEGGWGGYFGELRCFNVFPKGPRKDYTFWTVFANGTPWNKSTVGLPAMSKFRDAGSSATREQGAVNSSNGDGLFPITRYSEILLIYAEAANKAESSTIAPNAAIDAINLVRRRAGGNNQAVYADLPYGMTSEAFQNAVINERYYEFTFECKRWFDLVRLEKAVEVNHAEFPTIPITSNNLLMPIPSTELDLMPNLVQNLGY